MSPNMTISCGIGPKTWCVMMLFSFHLALILHLWMKFVGLHPMKELHYGPIYKNWQDASNALMGPYLKSFNLGGMQVVRLGSIATKTFMLWITHSYSWPHRLVYLYRFWLSKILPWCEHFSALYQKWQQYFTHDDEYFEFVLGDPQCMGEEMFIMRRIGTWYNSQCKHGCSACIQQDAC
jgi:hypothetical protein